MTTTPKVLIVSLTLAASVLPLRSATASMDVEEAVIADVAINTDYGNRILIKVAVPPSNPTCGSPTGSWHYVLSLDTAAGKNLYAMILSAFASQSRISASGTGTYNEWTGIETLRSIHLSN